MHNESLKWQTTKSTNLALELGFLDQRLTARVEYYRKITDNMVTSISLAPSLGFGSYPENLGKIENKGWEISLSAIPYKNTAKQAYWTITVNGSRNTDKLLEISEAMKHRNDMNASNLTDTSFALQLTALVISPLRFNNISSPEAGSKPNERTTQMRERDSPSS